MQDYASGPRITNFLLPRWAIGQHCQAAAMKGTLAATTVASGIIGVSKSSREPFVSDQWPMALADECGELQGCYGFLQ